MQLNLFDLILFSVLIEKMLHSFNELYSLAHLPQIPLSPTSASPEFLTALEHRFSESIIHMLPRIPFLFIIFLLLSGRGRCDERLKPTIRFPLLSVAMWWKVCVECPRGMGEKYIEKQLFSTQTEMRRNCVSLERKIISKHCFVGDFCLLEATVHMFFFSGRKSRNSSSSPEADVDDVCLSMETEEFKKKFQRRLFDDGKTNIGGAAWTAHSNTKLLSFVWA